MVKSSKVRHAIGLVKYIDRQKKLGKRTIDLTLDLRTMQLKPKVKKTRTEKDNSEDLEKSTKEKESSVTEWQTSSTEEIYHIDITEFNEFYKATCSDFGGYDVYKSKIIVENEGLSYDLDFDTLTVFTRCKLNIAKSRMGKITIKAKTLGDVELSYNESTDTVKYKFNNSIVAREIGTNDFVSIGEITNRAEAVSQAIKIELIKRDKIPVINIRSINKKSGDIELITVENIGSYVQRLFNQKDRFKIEVACENGEGIQKLKELVHQMPCATVRVLTGLDFNKSTDKAINGMHDIIKTLEQIKQEYADVSIEITKD